MNGFIVELTVLPEFPGHSQPAIGKTAIGMLSGCTVGPDTVPVRCCPCRLAQRSSGPWLGEVTKVFVARSPKANDAAFAAHFGHGTGTGKGLDMLRCWKTLQH